MSSGTTGGRPPAAGDSAGAAPDRDALERARAALRAHDLPEHADRAGHAGDMLVVQAAPGRIDDVRACAPELRKLGFRYVTIEIAPDA